MMFSLHDIDFQVDVFKGAADDLEERANRHGNPVMQALLRGNASGLREAASALERMIENEIEREAREAMRP